MKALAFSNNDMAIVAWTYDRHLDGCLGFAVYRQELTAGTEKPLPAMARFKTTQDQKNLTTAEAPVQKFWWKDLGVGRGSHVRYRIVPLGGAPGALKPLAGAQPLVSNSVTVTADRGAFDAYFNRGIVATQAVSRALGDKADVNQLKRRIADPEDPIRKSLEGELFAGVTSLLDQADAGGGTILAALYELNDPKGLEVRLQAKDHGDPASRRVILGNERSTDRTTKVETGDVDAANRQALKDAGVEVTDRILAKNSIPHNKFMVLQEHDAATAVLTGSTNWTASGLCTQTNNALIIRSKRVAERYVDYWNALLKDTETAGGDQKALQGPAFRRANHAGNGKLIDDPITLEDGSAQLEVMFSPNTNHLLTSPPRERPDDMGRLFELVAAAKQAVLFLAFDPGNNSILDAAGAALRNDPSLFVRGALTSPARAVNFKDALNGKGDQQPDGQGFTVGVVGEPAGPRKATGERGVEPDYRAVPAGHITKDDAFGAWEAEIYNAGFAIIHDKIVVIDPFSDACVVITGSHNLGFRASHNNDENMVIIHGHRPLAEAYACHVLDLYDHYAWRYWLQKSPDHFGKPLDEDDGWQERYITPDGVKSPELRFWLSAQASEA